MSTWTAAWKEPEPTCDLEECEMEWGLHHLFG